MRPDSVSAMGTIQDMTDCNSNDKHIYYYESDISDLQMVMKMLRFGFKSLGGIEVMSVTDHSKGEAGRPAEEIVEYRLDGSSTVVIMTHGSEPKLEVCISIADNDRENAAKTEERIREDLENIIHMDNRMGYCCE